MARIANELEIVVINNAEPNTIYTSRSTRSYFVARLDRLGYKVRTYADLMPHQVGVSEELFEAICSQELDAVALAS